MADESSTPADSDAPGKRSLEQRIMQLEIACDRLRYAVRRSTDLTMSVTSLVNVQDQGSANQIFRDMKQAIAEINAWASIDQPLFVPTEDDK